MRIYMPTNVMEAGLGRIRRLFDEFEEIIVSFSGGKDSTVVLELALQVARERGRLPLKVMFLDQEAEWSATIAYVKEVMYRPDVEPWWMQVPIRLFNATSQDEQWLHCWDPAAEDMWVRPKDPIAKQTNIWGSDRFHDFFDAWMNKEFKGKKACMLAGMRAEESPSRALTLTSKPKFKWITYGKRFGKGDLYTFYPLYDWGFRDIWKAIHDHRWHYCKIYDAMYQYGIPVQNMRVSNLTHETAIRSLYYLQELEGETWKRVQSRLKGVNTAKVLNTDGFVIKDLPSMFKSWPEYRDFLVDKLVTDEKNRESFHRQFKGLDEQYKISPLLVEDFCRLSIQCILVNDYHGTKLSSKITRPETDNFRKFCRGVFNENTKGNKYVQDAIAHGFRPPMTPAE